MLSREESVVWEEKRAGERVGTQRFGGRRDIKEGSLRTLWRSGLGARRKEEQTRTVTTGTQQLRREGVSVAEKSCEQLTEQVPPDLS